MFIPSSHSILIVFTQVLDEITRETLEYEGSEKEWYELTRLELSSSCFRLY